MIRNNVYLLFNITGFTVEDEPNIGGVGKGKCEYVTFCHATVFSTEPRKWSSVLKKCDFIFNIYVL